tara:strand:- start:127 stop:312 length:186 start_codon:yes stop_codon:yes gene_type:complete
MGEKMREVNEALYKLELLYLDYVNNFITVKRFAEFYGISEKKALSLIDIGNDINLSGVRNE